MYEYTETGHLVGMLDRDQRTAKIRYNSVQTDKLLINTCDNNKNLQQSKSSTIQLNEKVSHHRCIPRRTGSIFSCKTRENSYMWKSLLRLRHVLIVGVYLSLVNVPGSLSAPTNRHMAAERLQSHPKWINPCGHGIDNGAAHDVSGADVPQLSNADLLSQIIRQAKIAHSKADRFKENFVRGTFDTDFDALQETWKNKHYNWLPSPQQVPKNLGETVADEHLASLELDESLLSVYDYLQRLAVGLEQIVIDKDDEHGSFLKDFAESEHYLRSLLCDIQIMIYERHLSDKIKNVQRDIMNDEFRNMDDHTARDLRDFLIYRDYMNVLEYIIQIFDFIKCNKV